MVQPTHSTVSQATLNLGTLCGQLTTSESQAQGSAWPCPLPDPGTSSEELAVAKAVPPGQHTHTGARGMRYLWPIHAFQDLRNFTHGFHVGNGVKLADTLSHCPPTYSARLALYMSYSLEILNIDNAINFPAPS